MYTLSLLSKATRFPASLPDVPNCSMVSALEEAPAGDDDGLAVGLRVGAGDGFGVGTAVGLALGSALGSAVGSAEGSGLGASE